MHVGVADPCQALIPDRHFAGQCSGCKKGRGGIGAGCLSEEMRGGQLYDLRVALHAAAQTEREQTSRELSAAEGERAAALAALESQLAALQADHAAESDAAAVRHREALANEQAKARV